MKSAPFAILQIKPGFKNATDGPRLGVLEPVNADGFFFSESDARDVSEFMASKRSDLETYVVQVVRKVAP